jgi:hypothetical protein
VASAVTNNAVGIVVFIRQGFDLASGQNLIPVLTSIGFWFISA